MSNKHQRIADFLTRRFVPDPDPKPAKPSVRMTFREWSQKTERIPFVPKDTTPKLGIVTRVMPTIYPWRELAIEIGEPFASITLNRPYIRYPEPYGPQGLTDPCRKFIIESVRRATEQDGRLRSITWPDEPSDEDGQAD